MTLDLYSAVIATLGILLQAIVVWVLWPYLNSRTSA